MLQPSQELLKILTATLDTEASPRDLGLRLSTVEGLEDRLFRYVGQYYRWLGTELRDPSRITVLLGPKVVGAMCVQHALVAAADDLALSSMVQEALWVDCVRRAIAARRLSALYPDLHADEAFTLGLCAEFGVAMLIERTSAHLAWAREVRMLVGRARQDKELEVFSNTHDRAFVRAARAWDLPDDLITVIALSHSEKEDLPSALLPQWTVVHWADLLGEAMSARDAGARLEDWVARITTELELNDREAWDIVGAVLDSTPKVATALGVPVPQQPTLEELVERRAQRPDEMDRAALLGLVKLLEEDNTRLTADRERLRSENKLLRRSDPVTGLPTLVAFRAILEREVSQARRLDEPLCLVVFDVDGLLEVNARMGYDKGNLVLRKVAEIAHKVLRDRDQVGRLEGDTFAVLLHTDERGGQLVAERMRAGVEAARISLGETVARVTLKVVGRSLGGVAAHATADDLLISVLRQAKSGREQRGNRVYWG